MIELPEGWSYESLRDLCLPIDKCDPVETGRRTIKYIDIGGVDGATHALTDVSEVSAEKAPSRCRQIVRSGDTIFSTVRPYLEKIAYVDASFDREFASTGFSVLRPGPRLYSKFLYYFSISPKMLNQVLQYQKGVSYPAVLDKEVRAAGVPLPPRHEQHRIVDILEDHLSRLDAAGACLSAVESRAKALEQAALARCRAGAEVGLATVTEIQGGIQKQQKRTPKGNSFPFLRVANVTSAGLDLADVHRVELFDGELVRLRLRAGDLLVVEGNGSPIRSAARRHGMGRSRTASTRTI